MHKNKYTVLFIFKKICSLFTLYNSGYFVFMNIIITVFFYIKERMT